MQYQDPLEIIKQGTRVNVFLIEEIRAIFFESLYQSSMKDQASFISRRLRERFGCYWFVFMWDERRENANPFYTNNMDLVFQFKWLDWHVLIYGIDPKMYK
ncbi:unnamed protein product [Paramecium sonneborni]|uniref:Uncharacterized protein n=1 Tax=Paramecium sonneborni TaxID=65129 RepID=A0A8S1KU77_9CILI|nr:unnamed protein product [Paramecium sonneborni]